MERRRILSLLLLMVLAYATGYSQSSTPPIPYYYFSQYQASNGLPSNNVPCFAQDQYGFLWVGTGNGICRYDGYHFTTVYDMEQCRTMGGDAEAIFVDNDGLVWFATASGKGCYDSVTGMVTDVKIETEAPITSILQDAEGKIWFCSSDLYRYDKNSGEIKKYPSGRYNFTCAVADTEGQVWCTSSDGRLLAYDSLVDLFKEEDATGLKLIAPASGKRLLTLSDDGKVSLFDPYHNLSETIFDATENTARHSAQRMARVSCMLEREEGEYWIGTDTGIYICFEDTGRIIPVLHSDSENMSLSSDDIISLATDREGNVWAGTFYNGLNLWRNNDSAYSFFYPINQEQSISGTIFRAVKASNNRIWAATEDGELNYLQTGEPFFHQFNIPGERNDFHDILPIGEELWISTHSNGIFHLSVKNLSIIRHYQTYGYELHRQIQTSAGDILVGTSDGVLRYTEESDSFVLVNGTEGADVFALCEDSYGRIWLGTTGKGIIILDSAFKNISTIEPKLRVTSLFEDSRHVMWATTDGDGAFAIDIDSLSPFHLSKDNGFQPSITCAVAEDNDGMIWVSSDNGLHLIDPSAYYRTVSSFFGEGDTQSCQFTYGAVSTAATGTIFMGTTYGLFSFVPSKMKSLKMDKAVYISSIKGLVGDRLCDLSEVGRSAMHSNRIVASYKEATSLRIRYSCQNFASPISNRYKYTLSSRNSSVSEVTSERMALFFNVGYGKHLFTVSLVGSDAPESTKSVKIIIRPPFYRSAFAICIFILAILSMVGALAYYFVRWRRRGRMLQQERIEKERQKELYESKNAFFMNITHEIRTPLSLIKMPLDHMIQTGEYSKKDLLVIQANTDRLLSLINQLLDIRKLEQKEEKLEFTKYDLCDIVRKTTALFKSSAEDQGVKFSVLVPEGSLEAMCAKDSVEKIISNLITNALKYGNDIIDVTLSVVDGKAILRVDSNGDHIPAKDKDKIFEKFVHGGKGSGLGLPLAKTLAEQHDGRLFLDTSRKDMNSFVFEMPLEHPESVSLGPDQKQQVAELEQEYNDARRDIMIVEDNPDFRLYLAESLSSEFNIFSAANGRAAIEKLSSRKVDLIISDIMMPVMDGCELCNYVKTHVEYSHIPVILLTAAVGMETRIETLQVGADGYIEKPFPIELLMANINNLFKNRDIAYHQFSKSPLSHFNAVSTNKMDEEFMEKLHAIMLEKMADNTLSIDDLSSALSISNSTLFRKVKANTGMNINEYIRISRLKRAAELLASRQYRINEVADMVGFSSSSYFSSNFQKQFNISPSAFVKGLSPKTKDEEV